MPIRFARRGTGRLREATNIIGRASPFLRDFVRFAGRRLWAALALMLLAAALEGVSLTLLVPLLGLLTVDRSGFIARWVDPVLGAVGIATPLGQVAFLVGIVIAAMTLRAGVLLLRDRRLSLLQIEYTEARRLGLVTALARSSWSQVATLRHARITSALTVDINRLASAAQIAMQSTVAVVTLAVHLAVSILLVPVIGLAALAAIAIGAALTGGRLRAAGRHGETLGKGTLSLVDTASQLLAGLKSAVAENRQDIFVQDFTATGRRIVEQQDVYYRRSTRFHFILSVAIAAIGGTLLVAGIWLGSDRAALIAALVTIARMAGPVAALQRNAESFAQLLPAFASIAQLERELRGKPAPPPGDGPPLGGDIVLDNIGFGYAGGADLRDISLRIAPGEIVGIIGASGAGKTTLVDLIAGLIAPHHGTIRIGGVTLSESALPAWRNRVAYAGQEAHLANDTIRRNLAAAANDADEAMMWDALERAAIADTVRAMPEGLDTIVAERGSRLSGGERQRLAIARALLRRPALLILDEATNAIDVATEAGLLAGLASLDPPPVILVVAHRSETLLYCTRVVTIERGRVIADRNC